MDKQKRGFISNETINRRYQIKRVKMRKAAREQSKAYVLRLYRRGASILEACQLAGVTRSTFYKWLSQDESYREKYYNHR